MEIPLTSDLLAIGSAIDVPFAPQLSARFFGSMSNTTKHPFAVSGVSAFTEF